MRVLIMLALLALGGCAALGVAATSDRAKDRRDARQDARAPEPTPPPFDPLAYRSVTDCLNAAALVHADLNQCERRRGRVVR